MRASVVLKNTESVQDTTAAGVAEPDKLLCRLWKKVRQERQHPFSEQNKTVSRKIRFQKD